MHELIDVASLCRSLSHTPNSPGSVFRNHVLSVGAENKRCGEPGNNEGSDILMVLAQCIPSKEGPCQNCLRRYPPVECIGLREAKGQSTTSSVVDRTSGLAEADIKPEGPVTTTAKVSISAYPKIDRKRPTLGAPRPFGGILTEMTTLK
jgi:hypothetical protein